MTDEGIELRMKMKKKESHAGGGVGDSLLEMADAKRAENPNNLRAGMGDGCEGEKALDQSHLEPMRMAKDDVEG